MPKKMIRHFVILFLSITLFLTSFGQSSNERLLENAIAQNDSIFNGMNYYSTLKLIDSFENELQKDKATCISGAQFSPVYIGEKHAEINITYKPSNIGNRTLRWGVYEIPHSKSMVISIDTTRTIGSPMGVWGNFNKPEFRDDKKAYPVFIESLSLDTLEIGFGDVLPIIMEAKDENGIWKPIQKRFIYGCGKGLTKFYLAPKQIAVTTMKQFDGVFKTKLRLVFSYTDFKVYSNEIDGFIDKGQFE